jgi:hypothetical protein
MHLIEFEWVRCIDGFRIGCTAEFADGLLEAASTRFELYRPTKFPALFQQFAGMPRSAEGMRDFANSFGLLTDLSRPSANTTYVGTLVYPLLEHHGALCSAISLFEAGDSLTLAQLYNRDRGRNSGFGQLRTELRPQPGGNVSLAFVPSSLIDFLWLQFALHIVSEAKLLRCEKCGLPFPVGTGTGRRETAKFCSNPCKVASFRKRRAAARLLEGSNQSQVTSAAAASAPGSCS